MRSKSLSLFLLPWHEKIYIMPCKISSCKKSNTWPNKGACICRKLIKFFSSNNKTFWSRSTFEENWLWNRINFSCTTWTKEAIKTLCTYYFYSSRVVNIFFSELLLYSSEIVRATWLWGYKHAIYIMIGYFLQIICLKIYLMNDYLIFP